MRLINADKAVEQINEWLDQTRAIPLNTSYHFELLGCVEDCACNFNDNDEWLPMVCDFRDTVCPNPGGVACWEQYLKHNPELLNGKQLNKESEVI